MDFLKDKKLMIGAVFLIIAAALFFFFDLTYWAKIKATQAEIEKVRRDVTLAQDLLSVISDLNTSFGNLSQQADRIEFALPSRAEIPVILVQLSSLTAQNGLTLNSISFSDDRLGGGYSSVRISMQLSGNYEALKTFLVALEQNLRIIDVGNLSFAAPKEIGGTFDFGISVTTYYQ